MKKILFAAMAATALLSSCNKDNEGVNNAPEEGQKAKLIINVTAPETRAIGTAAPTGDDVIKKFSVFVFDGAGALQERKDVGTAASTTTMTGVTTAAKEVYVVANADAAAIPADVDTKSEMESFITTLGYIYNQTISRWATGKNATALSFTQNGSDFESTATITMKFISARFTVKVVPMDDYDNTKVDGSLVLTDVAVLNAGAASKLFSPSLMPSVAEIEMAGVAAYYAGVDMPFSFQYVPAEAVMPPGNMLNDPISTIAKADFATKVFYYYGFENTATTAAAFPTILVLKGTYDGQPIYFPVHLAPYELFNTGTMTASVLRGNSYDVTITLKGKANINDGGSYPGETGGDDDPTTPMVSAKVSVNLSINDWAPVPLNKEF